MALDILDGDLAYREKPGHGPEKVKICWRWFWREEDEVNLVTGNEAYKTEYWFEE